MRPFLTLTQRKKAHSTQVPTRTPLAKLRLIVALTGLAFGLVLQAAAAGAAQYASLVLDAQTGRILQASNIDTRVHPASLTKIMTLYMAFDALRDGRLTMDQQIPISAHAAAQPPSKIGLAVGQTISVRDAIMILITKSANDIAVAVAEAVSGTEAEFCRQMTALAQQSLDMPSTVFMNASGLPNSRQVTTARDMVNLAIRVRAHFPEYWDLFSTRSYTYRGAAYRNHNGLLGQYDGLDGIKTGFINASGFNLVASAERDGRRIYGVVFGGQSAQSRNNRMVELLDYGFAHLQPVPDTPAFAPARGGQGAVLIAAAPPPSAATAVTTPTGQNSPLRPALAPPVRNDNPSIADLIATSAAQSAESYPTIRFAQLLAFIGAERPRPAPRGTVGVQSSANSVPLPLLQAALDPAKITPVAGSPLAALPGCTDRWAVQVGAYASADLAQAVATDARMRSTGALREAAVEVDRVAGGGQPLYRALLTGLSDQASADTACVALQVQGIACLALSADTAVLAETCS